MNKYLIIVIALLLSFSLVFGVTHTNAFNKFATIINNVTDNALGLISSIMGDDFNVLKRELYTVDFKYANLGYIENFEYGIVDKAQYLRTYQMPYWFNENITGITVKGSFDPYYNLIDIHYNSSMAPYAEFLDSFSRDVRCIHYNIEITIYSDIVDSIIEVSKTGVYTYDVYILGDGGDSYKEINGEYIDIDYIVLTGESVSCGGVGYQCCIASDEYNNIFEFCVEIEDEYRLNGNHQVLNEACIRNVRQAEEISGINIENIFFAKFIK